MPEKDKKSNWFLSLIILSCLAVIFSAFYSLYFKKTYDFIVEVPCDTTQETCFQRDCTNPDDCPPNGLFNFKRYTLNAVDFSMCEGEDCTSACSAGLIECELMECEESPEWGESCVSPESVPLEGVEA